MTSNFNPISATAGAIPYVNEKGEISMKTVKVNRYVAGKIPDYCQDDGDNERFDEMDEEDKLRMVFPDRPYVSKAVKEEEEVEEMIESEEDEYEDARLKRLKKLKDTAAPQLLDDSDSETEDRYASHIRERQMKNQLDSSYMDGDMSGDENEEDDEDDEERTLRRLAIRQKALAADQEATEEYGIQGIIPANDLGDDDDFVEYSDEEESDSDNEKEPKLKPVFVPANQRKTINKTHEEDMKEQEKKKERLKWEEDVKRQKRKLIEEMKKEEVAERRQKVDEINTDDEDDAIDYEAWKIREMKRIKIEKDEKEQRKREQEEVNRIRGMTEEERLEEFKKNPRKITNAVQRGKMKFMQRYHHRGAFYVQELEDEVFQRDFTAPTLEDNFNITKLPKIKQVKNFGRAGRTKYTHLVDVDTTDIHSAWSNEGMTRFHNNKAGGMKQTFEKPTKKK